MIEEQEGSPRRRRSGGRAGRIAERQAPPAAAARPVWPGMAGGRYAPLSDGDMQQIYDTALGLLENVGMGTPIAEYVEVVTRSGGWLDAEGRLHYPRALVERGIEMSAKEWIWHGFDDDTSIHVGGNRVHFGTAGAAVLIHDYETNRLRHSTIRDVYDCARLVDSFDHIHFYGRTCVAPRPDRSPRPRPLHRLRGADRHVQALWIGVVRRRPRGRIRRDVRHGAR